MSYKSDKPCVVCGESRDNYVCYHHMVTRGAGGSDHPFNLMPVCQRHHNEAHSMPLERFTHKYSLEDFLVMKAWEKVEDRWLPPVECYK